MERTRVSFGPRVFFIYEGIMQEKEFKTLEELIDILTSRGIQINTASDIDYAKRVLEKIGYYNLINGYSNLFIDHSNEKDIAYKSGTTIKEINALYQFDRVLKDIFFRYILEIESNIKSLIAYYFSQAHGHKNYLIFTNFDTGLKDSNKRITNLIADIQKQIAYRSDDPSISHYLSSHGYIPLWVLNNIITFGVISKFYSVMMQPERQHVAKHFKISDKELENILFYLSTIRNFCAHGNGLYCFRNSRPLVTLKYHKTLNIPLSDKNEYLQGKRDLFAGVIALKSLLSNNNFNRMSKELFRCIGVFKRKISILKIEDVLTEMGFPTNWRDINNY